MRFKLTLLSILAVATILFSCKKEEDIKAPKLTIDKTELTFDVTSSEQTINLVSTRDWEAKTDVDWLSINPKSGKSSNNPVAVKITVLENKGQNRTAKVTFTGVDSKELTVNQSGSLKVLYFNDFDKEPATETNRKWPFADKFEGWKNQKGEGTGEVSYESNGVVVDNFRAAASNAGSSTIKDEASGQNHLSFIKVGSYVKINNIKLGASRSYSIGFAANKYDSKNKDDNTFDQTLFLVYVSKDGVNWANVPYEFNKPFNGKWGFAKSVVTVPADQERLYVCFKAEKPYIYSLDDLKVEDSSDKGTVVDYSTVVNIGKAPSGTDPGSSEETPVIGDNVILFNNFDKEQAEKKYGKNNKYFPFLDQFNGWLNQVGTGVAGINYVFAGYMNVESWHSSNTESDYAGSGLNSIKFGNKKFSFLKIENIALKDVRNYRLSLGLKKYVRENFSFSESNFNIYVAADNKWVELKYNIPANMKNGNWYLIHSDFTLPAGVSKINIALTSNDDRAISIDDVKLVSINSNGVAVDFSTGTELDLTGRTIDGGNGGDSGNKPGNGGDSGSGNQPGNGDNNPSASGEYSSNLTWEKVKDSYDAFIKPSGTTEVVNGFKIGTSKKIGSVNITIPANKKTLSFYGFSWKKQPTKVYISKGEKELISFDLSASDGLTGTKGQKAGDPYLVEVQSSNKCVIDLSTVLAGELSEQNVLTFSTKMNGTSAGRVVIFGIKVQ